MIKFLYPNFVLFLKTARVWLFDKTKNSPSLRKILRVKNSFEFHFFTDSIFALKLLHFASGQLFTSKLLGLIPCMGILMAQKIRKLLLLKTSRYSYSRILASFLLQSVIQQLFTSRGSFNWRITGFSLRQKPNSPKMPKKLIKSAHLNLQVFPKLLARILQSGSQPAAFYLWKTIKKKNYQFFSRNFFSPIMPRSALTCHISCLSSFFTLGIILYRGLQIETPCFVHSYQKFFDRSKSAIAVLNDIQFHYFLKATGLKSSNEVSINNFLFLKSL